MTTIFHCVGVSLGNIAGSITEPGNGIIAKIDGDDIYVGRFEWVSKNIGAEYRRSCPPKHTEVWVGSATQGMIGSIVMSDTIREEAYSVITELRKQGKNIYLLSGDDPKIAEDIGLLAGIPPENVFGGRKPEDKAIFVDDLKSKGGIVAMVGDGINDTIALGAADVGIAMGHGADAAGSAADIILLGDNLNQLVDAMSISRDTLSKIRQNLGLALIYNTIGIPIAAGVLIPQYNIMLSPTLAAGMMACSSIIVVSNSLLLKRSRVH